jgi:hypothetical protein
MNKLYRTATLLAAFGCFSLPALAGVIITSESSKPDGTQKQKSTFYVDGGRIRVETEGLTHFVMIFDANKQVAWMITPDKGTYMEMDANAPVTPMADRRQQAIDNSMKQMQDKMASLPPEQRAQMEQMMKGMTAKSAPATITFRSLDATDKAGPFTCSKYEALSNGKRISEHCTVPFDQLHLTDADVQSFIAFGKFMKTRMGGRGGAAAPPLEEMKGYPVRTISYNGDTPTFQSIVVSVEHKSVDSSMFTVPAGLKKEDPMAGRGGAPR